MSSEEKKDNMSSQVNAENANVPVKIGLTKVKQVRPKARKIDVATLYELRYVKGLTLQQVSDITGISIAKVSEKLSWFNKLLKETIPKEELDEFERNKLSIIKQTKWKFLGVLNDPEKIQKTPAKHAASIFEILNNSERLEEGKATSITYTAKLELEMKSLVELKNEIENMKKELNNEENQEVIDVTTSSL
jgi:transcriptional regulator with XRE-family HTH domain